jgi:hypothetical protein
LYETGPKWRKIMEKIIFSISPFQEWRKIMEKRSKLAIFSIIGMEKRNGEKTSIMGKNY